MRETMSATLIAMSAVSAVSLLGTACKTEASKPAASPPTNVVQHAGSGSAAGSAGSAGASAAGSATGSAAGAPTPTTLPVLAEDPGGATGTPRWSLGLGGLDSDHPRDIAVAADGTAFVAGVFKGEATFGSLGPVKTAGEDDGFVIAVGDDGKPRWVQRFGAQRQDVATGIATAGGTVVVAGNFADTATLGTLKGKSAGSDDLWVGALDAATGAPRWLWTAGGYDADGATDVAAAPDGGWIVTGSFSGSAKFGDVEVKVTGGDIGGPDALLVKLAATGEVLWAKSFGGTYADYFHHVAVDVTGNIYVLGTFDDKASFGGDVLTSAGDTDVVLISYDAAGNHRWSRRFGKDYKEAAGGITVDPAGNVTIAGAFTHGIDFGGGEVRVDKKGTGDAFVASFSSDGTPRWDRTFGNDREEVAYGVAADASGNVVVVGRFFATLDFGTGPHTADYVNRDAFVVKLDSTGKTVWSRTFGDKDDDEGRAVAMTAGGEPVVAGIFRFALDLVAPTIESVHPPKVAIAKADIFVARFTR